jgi:adenylate cyclase
VQDRPRVWLLGMLLALPLLGLVLLLAVPSVDVMWEHHPSHFLLVLAVALINVALALVASDAAHRRADARLFLVSLALITSSGFLALHALATPGVLLDHPNSGFVIATPIGLLLASGFAAASAVELDNADAARILRRRTLIRGGLALLLIAWAVASVAGVSFLDSPLEEEAPLAFPLLAPIGIGLYAFAAWRYLRIFRTRRRMLPLSVAVAFLLLAEALIAVAFARSWHASWWEWHVLMAVAFAIVIVSVRTEYRREGSVTAAFGGLYLEQTLESHRPALVWRDRAADARGSLSGVARPRARTAPARRVRIRGGRAPRTRRARVGPGR